MKLFVGTFNVPYIYTLFFDARLGHLNVTQVSNATGPHAWLSFAPNQETLYAAAWEPSSVVAYRIRHDDRHDDEPRVELANSKPVVSEPGYVAVSRSYLYSVGGASGEVFHLCRDGSLGDLVQEIDFASSTNSPKADASKDDGGLSFGAHGVVASPDGKTLFVADIGSNAIWTFSISETDGSLADKRKHGAVRRDDGPRHVWPHPNGRILYVVHEHSSMVDVFQVTAHDNGTLRDLEHLQGASVLPEGKNVLHFRGDEVRLSTGRAGVSPRYLFASTRGVDSSVKGFVSVFELGDDGRMKYTKAIDIWETRTSGGWANAIEPAPWSATRSSSSSPSSDVDTTASLQYLALTDDEAGRVSILAFNGTRIWEMSAVTLRVPTLDRNRFSGTVRAATAVWVKPGQG